MRIVFLADASLPHTRRWVNSFADRGHTCLLASAEPGPDYRCETLWLPARPALPRFLRYTLAVPAVRRLLARFAPDVVNAHFLPNYGWIAARAGARPLVLTTLGSDVLLVPHRSPAHLWRTRHVLGRGDAVTSDAAMLTAAIERFGVPPAHILTVPLGIEADRFATEPARPESPIVVLSTRRLEPVYDIETLLAAWRTLGSDAGQHLVLRIAGMGSRAEALRASARALPVAWLGWLDPNGLDAALREAHLYVSTSRSDSTSVSLLEAMAAGAFPIVSDIPANREWITDGETGLFFPVGDAAALAACLRRAAGDPGLCAAAAARNRATVARRATWDVNLAEVEALFARIATRGRRGG